jgi:hypothetical protein
MSTYTTAEKGRYTNPGEDPFAIVPPQERYKIRMPDPTPQNRMLAAPFPTLWEDCYREAATVSIKHNCDFPLLFHHINNLKNHPPGCLTLYISYTNTKNIHIISDAEHGTGHLSRVCPQVLSHAAGSVLFTNPP